MIAVRIWKRALALMVFVNVIFAPCVRGQVDPSTLTYSGSPMTWQKVNDHYTNCATALAGELMWIGIPEWSGWIYTGWLRWGGVYIAVISYKQIWERASSWDSFNRVKVIIDQADDPVNQNLGDQYIQGQKKPSATLTPQEGAMLFALVTPATVPAGVSYSYNGVLVNAIELYNTYIFPITNIIQYSPDSGKIGIQYTITF
jgi:hypothetical protein